LNSEKIWKIQKKIVKGKIWKKIVKWYFFAIFFHISLSFHNSIYFSSAFSISYHYSTYFSSIFSISLHSSTWISSVFSISFHYSTYFSLIIYFFFNTGFFK
jgi:hypothetical protein